MRINTDMIKKNKNKKAKIKFGGGKKVEEVQMNKLLLVPKGKTKSFQKHL